MNLYREYKVSFENDEEKQQHTSVADLGKLCLVYLWLEQVKFRWKDLFVTSMVYVCLPFLGCYELTVETSLEREEGEGLWGWWW